MGLYLIFKGYKGYYESKPLLLVYAKPQYRDEIVAIYEKYKDETIEPKIIEAESLQAALKIYRICSKEKIKQYQQMQMEFDL